MSSNVIQLRRETPKQIEIKKALSGLSLALAETRPGDPVFKKIAITSNELLGYFSEGDKDVCALAFASDTGPLIWIEREKSTTADQLRTIVAEYEANNPGVDNK